jgi:hypothetical protein
MALALVSLRGLLPGLSGLIRERAALTVDNPALPLSDMPFAPVERWPPVTSGDFFRGKQWQAGLSIGD